VLRDLILSDGDTKLKDIMEDNIVTVRHDDPIEEAIEQAAKYDLLSTAVVNEEERLVGIIQIHDIIDEALYPLWKKKNKKGNNS